MDNQDRIKQDTKVETMPPPSTDTPPAGQKRKFALGLNSSTDTPPGQKKKFDVNSFFSLTMLKDFLDFKIMVIPIIIKYLYILALILCFFPSIAYCARVWHGFGLVLFPFAFLVYAILLHIILELIMLGFSILDTMRQIRNEITKLRD